jgi:hypothetical protein
VLEHSIQSLGVQFVEAFHAAGYPLYVTPTIHSSVRQGAVRSAATNVVQGRATAGQLSRLGTWNSGSSTPMNRYGGGEAEANMFNHNALSNDMGGYNLVDQPIANNSVPSGGTPEEQRRALIKLHHPEYDINFLDVKSMAYNVKNFELVELLIKGQLSDKNCPASKFVSNRLNGIWLCSVIGLGSTPTYNSMIRSHKVAILKKLQGMVRDDMILWLRDNLLIYLDPSLTFKKLLAKWSPNVNVLKDRSAGPSFILSEVEAAVSKVKK